MRAAPSASLPSAAFRAAGQKSLALWQNPNNGNKELLSVSQGQLTDHILWF